MLASLLARHAYAVTAASALQRQPNCAVPCAHPWPSRDARRSTTCSVAFAEAASEQPGSSPAAASTAAAPPPSPKLPWVRTPPAVAAQLNKEELEHEQPSSTQAPGTAAATSSSKPWVRAPPSVAAQLDEAEVERRRRISEANSGRVPWNKGRKHSPETIAKIKARTEEAMKRPETAANFKRAMEQRQQTHTPETRAKIGAKVRAHLEEKRVREGLPPKPEKPPKKERKASAKGGAKDGSKALETEGDGSQASTSEASGEGKATVGTGKKSRTPKAAADAEPKKRVSNSDEHKQAIREAIKAKWQDPAYREYMCQRMKEAAQRKAGGSGTSKPRSQSSSTTGASSNASLAQAKQQQQAWLQQVQGLVAQLLKMQEMLDTLDKQVAGMKAQAGAFANDPIMLSKLQGIMQQAQERRQEVAGRVAEQQAKIPPNVGYDRQGRVFLRQEPAQGESMAMDMEHIQSTNL